MSTLYFSMCLLIATTMAHPADLTGPHENEVPSFDFSLISREEWGARPPTETTPLKTPVPYVVIHHSYTPPACYDFEECAKAMRTMQHMHVDLNGWWDIGYNFGVGSDGVAYEGRGWESVGAHAKYFNSVSIGIVLIGDWTNAVPPVQQLKTAQALIASGVEQGYIKPDYRLVGHRQVRNTECPGDALFGQIKSWHHYSNFPARVRDLLDIPEISDETKKQIMNSTEPYAPTS